MPTIYFHGGVPGLKPGCIILPPTITKVRSCSDYGAAGVHRRDRVYLCTEPEGALIYAVMHPSRKGVVYQVQPIGEVEPDPDWTGTEGVSVQVERARVIRVFRVPPAVRAQALEQLRSDMA
jgi:rifampin ADP-ribosylating transferase